MSFIFLIEPPDEEPSNAYVTASRSKDFALRNFKSAETDVAGAAMRLRESEQKNDEDTWPGGQKISKAEDEYEEAQARLKHAKVRYTWEYADKWKTRFPRTAKIIARTKALLLRVDWSRIRPLILVLSLGVIDFKSRPPEKPLPPEPPTQQL